MTCFSNLAGCNGWPFGTPSILMMTGFSTWGIFEATAGRAVSGFPAFIFSMFSPYFIFCLPLSLFHFFFSLVSVVSSVNLLLNTLHGRSTRLLDLGHLHLSIGGLGMQGGRAWVRRAYSVALNGLWNGVVSVLWKSASGPFSILVFYTLCLLLCLYFCFLF